MSALIKIRESFIETNGDREAIKNLSIYLNNYPTENGYRVESFISTKFIKISVYKMEDK